MLAINPPFPDSKTPKRTPPVMVVHQSPKGLRESFLHELGTCLYILTPAEGGSERAVDIMHDARSLQPRRSPHPRDPDLPPVLYTQENTQARIIRPDMIRPSPIPIPRSMFGAHYMPLASSLAICASRSRAVMLSVPSSM